MAEKKFEMADIGIKLLHQAPLLKLTEALGPLQQLTTKQARGRPNLRIGKPGKLQTG